jgi:hypothetical protein
MNRMIIKIAGCCVALSSMLPASLLAEETTKPLVMYKPYIERQTFTGQSYFKDNNVWVYTQAFAKTLGMPPENIHELKGIEAAAFRVEDMGFKVCGMGRKDENCMRQDRCVTDIYIDEKKYPLPWATNQQADYLAYYNSTQWLATPQEIALMPNAPAGVISHSSGWWASLYPFADPETHIEVLVGHNGNAPKSHGDSFSGVPIYGYKRNVIAGLSMISLSYSCMRRNEEKPDITFSFRSSKVDKMGMSTTLKKFHEFVLPNVFERKIDAALQESTQRMRDYAKQLLNLK